MFKLLVFIKKLPENRAKALVVDHDTRKRDTKLHGGM